MKPPPRGRDSLPDLDRTGSPAKCEPAEPIHHIIAVRPGGERYVLESVYGRQTAEIEARKYDGLEEATISIEPDQSGDRAEHCQRHAPADGLCIHCHRRKAIRGKRWLCWSCAQSPDVRAQHPSTHPNGRWADGRAAN